MVLHLRLANEDVEPDPFDPGDGSREILVDDLFVQPDGLEDLRPAIALER